MENSLGRFNGVSLDTGKSQKTLADDGRKAQSGILAAVFGTIRRGNLHNFDVAIRFFLDVRNQVVAF